MILFLILCLNLELYQKYEKYKKKINFTKIEDRSKVGVQSILGGICRNSMIRNHKQKQPLNILIYANRLSISFNSTCMFNNIKYSYIHIWNKRKTESIQLEIQLTLVDKAHWQMLTSITRKECWCCRN